MKFKQSFIAAGLALATSFSFNAQAALVDEDGIRVDTDAPTHFQATGAVNANGTVPNGPISGIGEIVRLNGSRNFCTPGVNCELTFTFENFTTGGTGGTLTFYSDSPANYSDTLATATDGNVFLTLTSSDDSSVNATNLSGALLNVTGGSAASLFDTNGSRGGSDMLFTASWQPDGSLIGFNLQGSSDFSNDNPGVTPPSPTPEPSSLLLLSLGLLGLGAKKRASKK